MNFRSDRLPLFRSHYLLTLFFLILLNQASNAQSRRDLSVFGYFQGSFRYGSEERVRQQIKAASFALQQLNLLFRKEFNPSFSAFVNMEALNSYSSADGWGSLRFSEAWARYRANKELNVKVGLQVPIFNNLNDIRTRTPLLPYVFPAVRIRICLQHYLTHRRFHSQPSLFFGQWRFDVTQQNSIRLHSVCRK